MVEVPQGAVERAKRGDPDAFRAIVEAFEQPVYQTVFRLVGGRFPQDVEDITQDVFLKVFRSLHRFDPNRGVKFSTWVYAYVRNHCFDVLKKRRLAAVPLDTLRDDGGGGRRIEPVAAGREPEAETIGGELFQRITDAVAGLPDEQRLAFVLREYEGLDYREIARVADCSEGTVKSRLYRAREALRRRLSHDVLQ